jgi:hypothetical protein
VWLHFLASVLQQQACGFEYTSKLQRMFQDIGVSKDLNEQFKKHLLNSDPLDCKCSARFSFSFHIESQIKPLVDFLPVLASIQSNLIKA